MKRLKYLILPSLVFLCAGFVFYNSLQNNGTEKEMERIAREAARLAEEDAAAARFYPLAAAAREFMESGWERDGLMKEAGGEEGGHFSHYALIAEVERIVHSPEFAALANSGHGLDDAWKSADNDDDEDENDDKEDLAEGIIGEGDDIPGILEKLAPANAKEYISAARKVFSLDSIKEGRPYLAKLDPETGRITRFECEISGKKKLVVEGDEKARARLENIKRDIRLEKVEGAVEDNLFQAVANIGESPQLARRLIKLFGSEINFFRDLGNGDSFSVLVEKIYSGGKFKEYGRIIAAVFTAGGRAREAFLFRDGQGREIYYNADGENLNKTLLQSPLAVTRLTSSFSHNRFHPILHEPRPHLGVDYGAPIGTHVKAVGDGTVTDMGWNGGYGNQIVLKHEAGLESMYSHLAGYAKGIRKGARVKKGQVIGYVGSTGLSTGPHLDFRLRQDGKYINPVNAINPRGAPVSKVNMEAFKKARNLARAGLEGRKTFENYTVDSVIPLVVKPDPEEIFQAGFFPGRMRWPMRYRRFTIKRSPESEKIIKEIRQKIRAQLAGAKKRPRARLAPATGGGKKTASKRRR